MKTVFKYPFTIENRVVLDLPVGAQVLKFDDQNGTPCAWALVDPEEKQRIQKTYFIFGTGHSLRYEDAADISEIIEYVDTFQQYDGRLVWHVFRYKYGK